MGVCTRIPGWMRGEIQPRFGMSWIWKKFVMMVMFRTAIGRRFRSGMERGWSTMVGDEINKTMWSISRSHGLCLFTKLHKMVQLSTTIMPCWHGPRCRMAVASTPVRCMSCWSPLARGSGCQDGRWFHAHRTFTSAGADTSCQMAVARTPVRCMSCQSPLARGSGCQNGVWFNASSGFLSSPSHPAFCTPR